MLSDERIEEIYCAVFNQSLRSHERASVAKFARAIEAGLCSAGGGDREEIIDRLFEGSNHGTRREDVMNAFNAGMTFQPPRSNT